MPRQYDDTGLPMAPGRATVIAVGFDVGTVVETKVAADRIALHDQWRVTHVNDEDGAVGVQRIDIAGNPVHDTIQVIAMDEFVSTFVRVKAKNKVDIRPSIHGAPDIVARLAEAFAVQAMAVAMHRTCPDCVIMTQPVRRVVTTARVDRDAMLIPVSFRVRVPPAAYVQAEDDLVAEVAVAGKNFAMLLSPPAKEDAHAVPAFAVRTTGEETRVNVVIDTGALFVDFE